MENCDSAASLLNGQGLSSDLMSYSEICENIRLIMSEVINLKSNSSKSNDKKSEITELRMQVCSDPLTVT